VKAFIFNSGLGSRLGDLTADKPKCMVRLSNGESIFERQLRILFTCGIREFVVTTGPYIEQLQEVRSAFEAKGCRITFVPNDCYAQTNYIYSMFLAREYLKDDTFLMLHGDLVFDCAYAQKIIMADASSVGSVNPSNSLPSKDFKARIRNGSITKVSVDIFDEECVAFQPFYKLSPYAMELWVNAVVEFVERDDTGVYAENAANEVFDKMEVKAFSYEGHLVEEIDTLDDLKRVSSAIRLFDFRQQPIYEMVEENKFHFLSGCLGGYESQSADFRGILDLLEMNRPLIVSSKRFEGSRYCDYLKRQEIDFSRFDGFSPNPCYEEIVKGVKVFRDKGCDSLISFGGGSAIDIAKCIRAFAAIDHDVVQSEVPNISIPYRDIPHLAIPTTAGTGSESTHFAVVYVDGKKLSVSHDSLLPNAVLLDASLLEGLPKYQKKVTMLDALCQAIESYWSARSSEESREHSAKAIPMIIESVEGYIKGDKDAAAVMMRAANLSGKAINLTTTTAAHAMSYKLTSHYGISHGHAVAICMPYVWRFLIEDGDTKTQSRLVEIAQLMTGLLEAKPEEGLLAYIDLLNKMKIETLVQGTEDEIELLAKSVNIDRLANFPHKIDENVIRDMYQKIVQVS